MSEERIIHGHEKKRLIKWPQSETLSSFISTCMQKESSSSTRSLHFDTVFHRVYHDVNDNTEVQLSVVEPLAKVSELEIRHRGDDQIYMDSVRLTHEQALAFIGGDYSFLLKQDNEQASQIYAFLMMNTYRPAVIIDSDRVTYAMPAYGVRIIFDSNINVCHDPHEYFNPNAQVVPVFPMGESVVTVRYGDALPPFLQEIVGKAEEWDAPLNFYSYLHLQVL